MYKESESLELKSILTADIKKEIIAFANSKGGTIYIGIGDDGRVIGLEHADQVIASISSMIHDGIKPDLSLFMNLSIEKIDDRPIVKILVQRGTRRPYYLSDKGMKPTGVYVRLGNTSVPVSENAIRKMISETDGTCYEKIRSINQDLTFAAAETEFSKRDLVFNVNQKKTLGIIDADGQFTNLALLISDQCQHSIKAAVFDGDEKDEFITRKEFTGSLFSQMNEAYAFIELNNHLHSTFEGLTRIDSKDYSEAAIREALLNAVIHRDYGFSGSTLVSIFSNRLEIVSLGGLVPGLEPEDIFEGISQPRNSGLANLFYRLNYIEAYGTGIRKIKKACEQVGVSATFRITNGAFRVIIPKRNSVMSSYPDVEGIDLQVLEFIRSRYSANRKDLQDTLGLKQTKSGLILRDLENKRLITRIGSGKSTTYVANDAYKDRGTR